MHLAFQIFADGQDVTGRFQDRLIRMTVKDEAGQKSDTAEIELDNRDTALALPQTGAKLDLALGLGGALVSMGQYVVDEISGEIGVDTLTISAKAADMLGGIRARKTRAWSGQTLGAMVAQIAGEHELTPRVSASLAQHRYPYLAQNAESDLHFLTRLARDLDAVAKPASGHLVVVKRGEGKAADGSDLPVFTVHRTQMKSASFRVTSRGRAGVVVAEWGERAAGVTHKVRAGQGAPELHLRHRFGSAPEARRAARSALERGNRTSGTITVNLGGFWGELMAEAKVNMQGIQPELCGEWLINSVTHTLNGTLTTSFEAERDYDEKYNAAS
jgi:phage protein D